MTKHSSYKNVSLLLPTIHVPCRKRKVHSASKSYHLLNYFHRPQANALTFQEGSKHSIENQLTPSRLVEHIQPVVKRFGCFRNKSLSPANHRDRLMAVWNYVINNPNHDSPRMHAKYKTRASNHRYNEVYTEIWEVVLHVKKKMMLWMSFIISWLVQL